jgi:hypothetical protein
MSAKKFSILSPRGKEAAIVSKLDEQVVSRFRGDISLLSH